MCGALFIQHIIVWVILAALYLLFAGQVSMTEIEAGLPLTLVASALVAIQRRTAVRHWSGPVRAKALFKPILSLVPDAIRVGAVLCASLLRRPDGSAGFILRQPFRPGGNRPDDNARRGVTELSASFAPNAFAIRLREDALLLHCLSSRKPSPDAEWPA